MDDGSLGTPLMSDLDFISANPAVVTVSPQGIVTGVANGATDVTITTKSAKKLTVTANVTAAVSTTLPVPAATFTATALTAPPPVMVLSASETIQFLVKTSAACRRGCGEL